MKIGLSGVRSPGRAEAHVAFPGDLPKHGILSALDGDGVFFSDVHAEWDDRRACGKRHADCACLCRYSPAASDQFSFGKKHDCFSFTDQVASLLESLFGLPGIALDGDLPGLS